MFRTELLRPELQAIDWLHVIEHKSHHHNRCIYCQTQLSHSKPETKPTKDHVIPISRYKRAGYKFKHEMSKLIKVPACFFCNHLKANMSVLEFRRYILNSTVRKKDRILSSLSKLIKSGV